MDAFRAWAERLGQRAPIYFVCFLIGAPWLMFVYFISVDRVLQRGDILHFFVQIVVFHALLILTGISFIGATTRRPLRPDPSLAPHDARPLRPDEVRAPLPQAGQPSTHRPPHSFDDDDIPLRVLRESPRPAQAGDVPQQAGREGEEEEDRGEGGSLLPKDDEEHVPLMAKSGTGGPRWCRKCDAWKPDRCHHCRSCRQCVLKMDHHCPWLNNCVGYHNHKSFVLFTTYAALMALYGGIEAAFETYHFFADPPDITPGPDAAEQWDEWEEIHTAFKPVALLLIAIMGIAFGLAIGGLAGYHWALVLNNRTTLEDMNRLPPAALLDPSTRARLESLGERGAHRREPGAWRPDHILTRHERIKLRDEARSINVYNVGWRTNLRTVMLGDDSQPATSFKGLLVNVLTAANPLAAPRRKRHGAGHFFPHDPATLERLRQLTREMRVSGNEEQEPREEVYTGGEWTIGDDDSDKESDSDRTVYDEQYGERRRGRFDV